MDRARECREARGAPLGGVAIARRSPARRPDGRCAGRAVVHVARVSGGASYGCGGDPESWRPASVDLPLAPGDRLYTARGGRLEVRGPGFEIHLASSTGLEAVDLTPDSERFSVWRGSASFVMRRPQPGGPYGFVTPDAVVTREGGREYLIDVDREGKTCVVVRRGSAWVDAGDVSAPLGSGARLLADAEGGATVVLCPVSDFGVRATRR